MNAPRPTTPLQALSQASGTTIVLQLPARTGVAALSAACRELGQVQGKPVEVDVRLAGDYGPVDALMQELPSRVGLRFHCRPDQWARLQRADAGELECHVPAAQWLPWHAQHAGRTRLNTLSIYLAPGQPIPTIDAEVARVRFAFAAPAGRSRLADYRRLVPGLMAELRALAARWVRVSWRGALPFCLFSDTELGELARECLPHADYRSPPLVLAWRADGTVAPWSGRLRHLVRELEPGTDVGALISFYKARQLAVSAPAAFTECTACLLRRRGICSAWDDLAPPVPPQPTPGVWPAAALCLPGLQVHPHPAAALEQDGPAAWLLAIPTDRTLDAFRLNEGAKKLWDLIGSGGPCSELLARVEALWDQAGARSVLALIERLQSSGFVIVTEGSERTP